MSLKPSQKSTKNLIYKCSDCGNLHAMIKGEVAPKCEACARNNNNNNNQSWLETKQEIIFVSKNIKKMMIDRKNFSDKISDYITQFCGNIYFVYMHLAWFGVWLVYNTLADFPFDPYPFGMLTLVVSLEAIILATFILISQNNQGEISDLRSEADYQADLKSEKNIAEILAILKSRYKTTKKK